MLVHSTFAPTAAFVPRTRVHQEQEEMEDVIPQNEQEVLNKISELVSQHDELAEKVSFNEEMIFTLETELSGLKKLRVLEFMANDDFLCTKCKEIKDTDKRQLWLLNQMFNRVLYQKPKTLLHLSKIFQHLELAVARGAFEAAFSRHEDSVERCATCGQIEDPRVASARLESCILQEMQNLRSTPGCEHLRSFLDGSSRDGVGVEPLVVRRKASVSGLESDVSRLSFQEKEEKKGKRQQVCQPYGQQQLTGGKELKDAQVVYTLGAHLRLSVYSAAPHEDPNILLQKWELELRKCGVPRGDWVLFVTRSLRETALQWWELQGFADTLPWDEFKLTFQKAFGRVELRRWLAYAGSLCFSQVAEPVGTYVMRRFQIVLRAVNQNPNLALKVLEKHVNMRVGRYLVFNSYEDFFFAIVGDQVMDLDAVKLMFSQVLMEIRNDDKYWNDSF